MKIIGYHIWNGMIANSNGDYTDKPPYIDFLLQEQAPDTIRILYYLTQNVSALAKMIQMNESELLRFHNSSNSKIVIDQYKLRYVKDRFLNLQKGFYSTAPYAYFYDAHQYKDIQAENDLTVEDCIRKAKMAQEIGQQVYDTLNKLGIHDTKLISPVRAFEDKVLSKLDLPNKDDFPTEAGAYAYEGCVGNWLEAFQIGHWNKVWNYDIVSAYPSIIAQQMDLREGKWYHSKGYIPEARYGNTKCLVNIKSNISPIIFRAGERNNLPLNYTPVGEREVKLNKRLIDYIGLRGIDDLEIQDGYWWVPNKNATIPLKGIIDWLYLEKEKAESGSISKSTVKRIMAGIYGKFLEARDGIAGRYLLPIWAEDIETATRIKIMDFIENNNLNVIHIAVDGVVSANPAMIIEDKVLGEWELSNISPCICSGTGNVALEGNPNGNDFSLTYHKVKELIEKNPELTEYKISKLSPVTISEAVNSGKFKQLGQLQEIHKYIGIGQDEKRCYKIKPKNGGELLNGKFSSEPWDISMVRNIKEV